MAEAAKPRILVVDDEPDMARSLKKLLEKRFQASVEVATSADEARQKLTDDYDVITLDYQMPDNDGLTILKEIKKLPDPPPVIMVTGHGDEETAVAAFRNGAAGYVVKDQRLPELLADAVNKTFLETRLRETEKELADLVETANSVILKMDTRGTITFANPYALEFFGYSEEELIGKNVIGTILAEVESTGRNLIEVARTVLADSDSHQPNVNENIKKSGERVWISWTNRALKDRSGNVVGNLGVGNDITDLKQAEESLERQAEILQNIDEAIITFNDETRITSWSRGAENMYGFTAEEATGRRGDELLRIEYPQGDSIERRFQSIREKDLHRFESVNRRKDGTTIVVEASSWLVKDSSHDLTGYVSLHRDITEAKKAFYEIKWQRAILDQVEDAIFATDATPENKITFFNAGAEKMFGWKAEEVIGKPALEMLPTEIPDKAMADHISGLFDRGWFKGEVIRHRRDGTRLLIDANASVQRDQDGQAVSIVTVNREITECKPPEEEPG